MKRIFCIAFVSIACSFSFLTGYFSLYSVPVYGAQDDWEVLSSNDQLVDAFKVYCKSRNIAIDGSVLDAVTSFTTKTFTNICNTLGIDMTQLQAEIQRKYSGFGYKYAFSASGLSGFNRIFAEFLQNNDLAVGDTVDDKEIYNGYYFDNQFVYVANSSLQFGSHTDNRYPVSYSTLIASTGEPIYNSQYFYNNYSGGNVTKSLNLNFYGITHTVQYLESSFGNRPVIELQNAYAYGGYFYCDHRNTTGTNKYFITGDLILLYYPSNNHLYLGCLSYYVEYKDATRTGKYYFVPINDPLDTSDSSEFEPCNINITTNNQTINNETVINEGDTIIYNNDGTPDSGDDDPDQGDDWNPVLPEVPPAGSDPSGGNTIEWPDLDLPDFGLSNFSLGDLRLKFPFSIPFDIVSILGVVNAPAVAPVIQEDIPIRIDLMNVDYTIPINLDMSDSLYDNFAVLVRAVEFIGFCIGLIHLTIRLVKG